MSSHVTEIGHLIHELAHQEALERLKKSRNYASSAGRSPDPKGDVKLYNDSYDYHTHLLLCHYGFMTREEFRAWDKARRKNDYDGF